MTGDVKSNDGTRVSCRFQGEWNNRLEFVYENTTNAQSVGGGTENFHAEMLDVGNIDWSTRKIRPFEKQDPRESRRLWRSVTEALRRHDFDTASREKQRIEQVQRGEYGGDSNHYVPVFFEKSTDGQAAAASADSDSGYSWIHKDMPRVE